MLSELRPLITANTVLEQASEPIVGFMNTIKQSRMSVADASPYLISFFSALPKAANPYSAYAERLAEVRNERRPGSRYASLENCRMEINQAEELMRRESIPWLSSTTKSIEEIATTVLTLLELD
jgi:regulator of PEP synthase PpsR (kinase-PPPase family)